MFVDVLKAYPFLDQNTTRVKHRKLIAFDLSPRVLTGAFFFDYKTT
jgi:hypothetical protein